MFFPPQKRQAQETPHVDVGAAQQPPVRGSRVLCGPLCFFFWAAPAPPVGASGRCPAPVSLRALVALCVPSLPAVCVCVSVYPWVCTGVCSVGEQCTCVHVRVSVCREGNVCPRRGVCVRVYGGGKDPFTAPGGAAPPEHTRGSTEDPRTGGKPTALAPNPRTRAPRGTCWLHTEHRQGTGLCVQGCPTADVPSGDREGHLSVSRPALYLAPFPFLHSIPIPSALPPKPSHH